ncbi:hypothetical protein [Streptomyces sp. NPDC004721]
MLPMVHSQWPGRAVSPWILLWPRLLWSYVTAMIRRCWAGSVLRVTGKSVRPSRRGIGADSAANQNRSTGLVADLVLQLPAQHRVLVPQHERLDVFGGTAARQHRRDGR